MKRLPYLRTFIYPSGENEIESEVMIMIDYNEFVELYKLTLQSLTYIYATIKFTIFICDRIDER